MMGSPILIALQKLIQAGQDMDDLHSESGTDEEREQIRGARIYVALAVWALAGDRKAANDAVTAFANRCKEELAPQETKVEPQPIRFRQWT